MNLVLPFAICELVGNGEVFIPCRGATIFQRDRYLLAAGRTSRIINFLNVVDNSTGWVCGSNPALD